MYNGGSSIHTSKYLCFYMQHLLNYYFFDSLIMWLKISPSNFDQDVW